MSDKASLSEPADIVAIDCRLQPVPNDSASGSGRWGKYGASRKPRSRATAIPPIAVAVLAAMLARTAPDDLASLLLILSVVLMAIGLDGLFVGYRMSVHEASLTAIKHAWATASRWSWQLLIAFPFAALEIGMWIWARDANITSLRPALLTANVTIAVFAVNFSFLEYQFSSYRALIGTLPFPQMLASAFVLSAGLLPLLLLPMPGTWPQTATLMGMPAVAAAGILLAVLARHQARGSSILKRVSSQSALVRFHELFLDDAAHLLERLDRAKFTGFDDAPMHEWDHIIQPRSQPNDPFSGLASLGFAAIKNTDTHTFEAVVERALAILYEIEKTKNITRDYRLKRLLLQHAHQPIYQIAYAAMKLDDNGSFASVFLRCCSSFMYEMSMREEHTAQLSLAVMGIMVFVADELLKSGHGMPALSPVVVSRQVAAHGMGVSEPQDLMFDLRLPSYPQVAMTLGHRAIGVKDCEYLYRCLEALGFLGCTAVKTGYVAVGRSCLQWLAQLGREARASGLECFDSRCALAPHDHAEQRIDWIRSWVPSLEPGDRGHWLKSLGEAYSRLRGTGCTVGIMDKNGDPVLTFHDSGQPHKATYDDNGHMRTVDYSDPGFLKDLKLY